MAIQEPGDGSVASQSNTPAADVSCLMIKPASDLMAYRILRLENGLRVILVSDPEADKAAASMDVHVGSLADPDDFPGLAHFCEHMLFYASEKYPLEDEYSKFISDHGGHTNAWTASENTNYQFDVNWDHLDMALDRFAQFFVSPLISADGVEREVNAVDSEHGKNLASDPWRLMQLYKHTANQAHPWARFATGNRQTLLEGPRSRGLDPRQAVADFHSQQYSSNIMGLAVYSRHGLDELEAMVRPRFSAVPDKGLPLPLFSPDVFLEEQQGTLIKVVPVRDGHALELAWLTPPSWQQYKSGPLNFLSHLLGHEGEGSVFALLKKLGWATSLVAGESGNSISSTSFFYVKAELSEEGQAHAAEVGALIFKYVRLLCASEAQWPMIQEEVRGLCQLKFDFRDKPVPYSYVSSLSGMLQRYPERDLLLAMYNVPQEFRPDLVREALDCLTLAKVRTCWTSKSFEEQAVLSEPWYGTKYSMERTPAEWLERWSDHKADERLHLPRPNPFIPSDFTLHQSEAREGMPQVVLDIPGAIRLHHKCDLTFRTPKADILLDFQSPEAYSSPENAVMARIFAALIDDELSELTYDAELAGLRYSVYNSQAGFVVSVSGYNHKLLVLLNEVLLRVSSFKVKEDRLELVRERILKEFRNMKFQQPYQWGMYRCELLLNMKRWRVEEYLEVAPLVTPQQLQEFFKRMMSRLYIEGLAVGNITQSEVVGMAGSLKAMLEKELGTRPVFPSQMRDFRTVRLPAGTTLAAEEGPNPSNDNSAVVICYQVGPDDLHGNALLQLLVHLVKRDAFHMLRTQQQLGYIVSMFAGQELRVHSVEFVIQSNSFSAAHLAQRVEVFVQHSLDDILIKKCTDGGDGVKDGESASEATAAAHDGSGSPASEFAKAVVELAKSKLERPKTLGELTSRYWSEVYYGTLTFDRQEREVEQLKKISPEELLAFAQSVLGSGTSNSGNRRKLVVAVMGSSERAKSEDGPGIQESLEHGGSPQSVGTVESMVAAVKQGSTEQLHVVDDIAAFKRACEVFPNVAALYQQRRPSAQGSLGQTKDLIGVPKL